jgi:UDP-glucose 4-epimerase
MKILVTGGAGFIGSHTVDGLIASGHEVVVIDDLSSGRQQNVNEKAQFVSGSITDRSVMRTVFEQYSPFDAVFHFAAQKSVTHSVEDPIEDAERNIIGSLNLLEEMKKHKVPQIIFASTGGALYGDGVMLPATEASSIDPLSPYAIAKRATEYYLNFYRRQGMITQVMRYANVYGPRQDPFGEAGVMAIFCQRLVKGEPLTVFGTGEQTRDFVYVGDIVTANLAALSYDSSGTWNIGTGQEVSINEAVNVLRSVGQKESLMVHDVVYAAARDGEVQRSCLDASLAHKELNWKNQTSLEEGLTNTLRSFLV